jgi:hypothetical protein
MFYSNGLSPKKAKTALFIGILICCVTSLYAQSFTPRNGTPYTFNVVRWVVDGTDVWPIQYLFTKLVT